MWEPMTVSCRGRFLRTGLLSERDREKFRQADHALSAGGKEKKAYVQKFYLYMNLTKPSEKSLRYITQQGVRGREGIKTFLSDSGIIASVSGCEGTGRG